MNTEFYRNNEVRIGEDFKTSHPHYYSSLRNAFKNYFDTYLEVKDSVVSLVDFNWKREEVAFNFNISYDKVVSTILDFHRFFELLMKDLLQRFDPFLSVRVDKSAKDYFNFIVDNKPANTFKSVEFSEAKERLNLLIKKLHNDSEFAFIKKFDFLFDSNSGLYELSWWRNRLVHNGNKLPNIISLDYLISQKIIPLVFKVIEIEKEIMKKDYTPYYFETATGINIIERIIQIDLTKEDLTLNKGVETITNSQIPNRYIELYFLKGLGRATINYNKHLKININVYNEYHRIQYKDCHEFVKMQEKSPAYHKTNECLCCGNPTLVTFKEYFDDIIFNVRRDLIWSRCLVCDYGVSNKIGNPKNYKITEVDIFE